MADFTFELVTPERLLVSREASQVVVPASEGDLTAMPQHAPTMTSLRPGIVTVSGAGGEEERFVVIGGFADIQPHSCTILAETAAPPDDFDRENLSQRIEHLRRKLDESEDDEDRSGMENFLHQLITLDQTILPA